VNLSDKRFVVTGADGFIGSHLAEALVKNGAVVRSLVQYNSFNNWGWLDNSEFAKDMEIQSGDIRDSFFVKKLLEDADVVFNLAALIAIPYSYRAPSSYIETNINGALNICQAALAQNVKKIVQISTSEVYGTAQYVPIDEKHPLQPQSPYSASKIGADALVMSYYHAFELPVVIARPFNTYGPRQSARAVIPAIISQIASGQKQLKLGDISPTRDFNYVSDTCDGLISISGCDEASGETINIGSGAEISIKDLALKIKDIMGSSVEIVNDKERIRPSGSEVRRLLCDNSKIRKLTGHVQKIGIDEGLRNTVDWFSNPDNLKKYKADIYNV
jgi:NAD dependent epimerase/dehydratase